MTYPFLLFSLVVIGGRGQLVGQFITLQDFSVFYLTVSLNHIVRSSVTPSVDLAITVYTYSKKSKRSVYMLKIGFHVFKIL